MAGELDVAERSDKAQICSPRRLQQDRWFANHPQRHVGCQAGDRCALEAYGSNVEAILLEKRLLLSYCKEDKKRSGPIRIGNADAVFGHSGPPLPTNYNRRTP